MTTALSRSGCERVRIQKRPRNTAKIEQISLKLTWCYPYLSEVYQNIAHPNADIKKQPEKKTQIAESPLNENKH